MKANRQIFHFVGLTVLSGLVLVGCSREEKPTAEKGTFAIIDGVPFTAKDLRETVLVRAKMSELAKRPIKEEKFADWANGFAMHILPGLVQSAVLERALRKEGNKPTPESETAMFQKYNRMTKQKARSLDELAARFGDLEPVFRRQVARESLFHAYSLACPETKVSERELADFYEEQSNLVVQCKLITSAGWKKGRKAHAELKAGKSWESVAKIYNEDGLAEPTNVDNWKEWMAIPISKVEPKELADAVDKLKTGEYTEPIDIDEGLVIVRLNERDGDFCTLARILIRMGAKVEIPDRESVINEIRRKKWHVAQKKILEKARKDLNVEYLFTTNFSYKIWKSDQSRCATPVNRSPSK